MKFFASFVAIGLFAGFSLAQDTVQTAHVTLRSEGDDHSYPLAVPADGNPVLTYSTLPIQRIDAPDFNVLEACVIETPGAKNLSSTIAADGVTQQVVIDPPRRLPASPARGLALRLMVPALVRTANRSAKVPWMIEWARGWLLGLKDDERKSRDICWTGKREEDGVFTIGER
ncbi:hypothetical protein TrVFT333_002037 [Trichoderma virens FT-333]|nr:hypothetical protein TrVFT333_002037 [Trichoderma virens FT-333]